VIFTLARFGALGKARSSQRTGQQPPSPQKFSQNAVFFSFLFLCERNLRKENGGGIYIP
jgi:hypothetical protein